jgi:hypothetical protein
MEGVKWTVRSGTWAFIAGLSMLACSVGCNREPSAEELAQRINWDSATNEEDRKALVGYGQEAIDPCIERTLNEPTAPLNRSVLVEAMMSDLLKDISPEDAMAEIERRYENGSLEVRQRLGGLAIGIGEPYTRRFAEKQLDSLALENVAMAILLLEPYKNEKEVVATLDRSMESKDRHVRLCAAMIAIKESPKAISLIEEAIANEGTPRDLRLQLVLFIGEGPIVEAKAALRRLRSVKNKEVREMVDYALEQVRRPDPRY